MSYFRQPLLTPEQEEELTNKMSELWDNGFTGKQIAEILNFGEVGPYEKIKPEYVYYYRQKLNLPRRQKPKFSKTDPNLRNERYKVSPEEIMRDYGLITPIEFVELINEKLPLSNSFYYRRARAFNILLYNTPLRESEIRERKIKDFEIKKKKLVIHLLRKKKKNPNRKDEPISIPRTELSPLIEEVINWLESKDWDNELLPECTFNPEHRPFNFSKWTAKNYAKELGEDFYAHFYRFRYITDRANKPKTTILQLKAKTRLTLSALEKYTKTIEKIEEELDEETLAYMKEQGEV